MLRAVPSIMRVAASMFAALRSFILSSAIFCASARGSLATLFLFGSPEALSIFAAFFRRTAAGGVFDHEASLCLRALIELLAEAHDVDACLAECRTYRRSRVGLASDNLQLDDFRNFLCHVFSPPQKGIRFSRFHRNRVPPASRLRRTSRRAPSRGSSPHRRQKPSP